MDEFEDCKTLKEEEILLNAYQSKEWPGNLNLLIKKLPICESSNFSVLVPGQKPSFAEPFVAIVLQKQIILSILPFSKRLNIYPKDRYDFPEPALPRNIVI